MDGDKTTPDRKPERSIRADMLAEWRGYREPRKAADQTLPLATLLGVVLTSLGLPNRLKEDDVLAAWSEIAGPVLAPHSQPDKLRNGTLHVRVLQPTIRFELQRQRASIAAKLREKFGESMVKDVRLLFG